MLENMLDYFRISLYVLLVFVVFMLYQAWNQEHPPLSRTVSEAVSSDRFIPQAAINSDIAPSSVQALASPVTTPATPPAKTGQLVEVRTDLFTITIDTLGGDIIRSALLNYPQSLDSKTPYIMLNDNAKTQYIAESGLLSQSGPDTQAAQALYEVSQKSYQLAEGQNQLDVRLNWQNSEGVKVSKVFTFTRGSYAVKVNYDISNQSTKPWQGNLYSQLIRTDNQPEAQSGLMNLATFFGAALSSPQKPFEKINFKDIAQNQYTRPQVVDGWAAMIQHYFISAWIPQKEATSTYYARSNRNGLYTVGMVGQTINVDPGKTATTGATLYTGPAIAEDLAQASPTLKLTIDYGWFWPISVLIFWMMQHIYDWVGNWGWAIVIVTLLIKLIFYPLSAKSFHSMSGIKRLQPRIEMLKERYGDDRQKLTQATLDLYRQEKVNPMSGCLPVLIQIPVFIALYWVLVESVQLRQAPFILWIHDLSRSDPYYILPLLMGASMYLQQRLNPPPADPMQAKVMMLMPLIFTVLFLNFPAGLMLYWFVNNTVTFLQQWFIMHRIEKNKPSKR